MSPSGEVTIVLAPVIRAWARLVSTANRIAMMRLRPDKAKNNQGRKDIVGLYNEHMVWVAYAKQ